MGTRKYTPEQDAAILRCRGRDDLMAMGERLGKPWTTIRTRQRALRSAARLEQDKADSRARSAEGARRLREDTGDRGLTRLATRGRPAWFNEDTASLMKAGR